MISALEKDTLIYIENKIHDILTEFNFCYNNASTRGAIEYKVKSFLYELKFDGKIKDFDVICDERNNPPEVIENGNVYVGGYTEDNILHQKHYFNVSLQQ